MSGMCVINLYSSQIFSGAGINPKLGTFLVGIANVLGSIVPMMLIFKYGRRTLLYLSFGLMFICHSLIVIFFKTDLDSVSSFFLNLVVAFDSDDHMLPFCLPARCRSSPLCLHHRHLFRCWNEFRHNFPLAVDVSSDDSRPIYDYE